MPSSIPDEGWRCNTRHLAALWPRSPSRSISTRRTSWAARKMKNDMAPVSFVCTSTVTPAGFQQISGRAFILPFRNILLQFTAATKKWVISVHVSKRRTCFWNVHILGDTFLLSFSFFFNVQLVSERGLIFKIRHNRSLVLDISQTISL